MIQMMNMYDLATENIAHMLKNCNYLLIATEK